MTRSSRFAILVVEDEPFWRFDLAEELRLSGFLVIEAADSEEALTVLQASSLPVDLVCTDVQMPGAMSGLDLAGWVRQHRPEIRVAIMTGARETLVMARSLTSPALVFEKPCSARDMAVAFRGALGPKPTSYGAGAA